MKDLHETFKLEMTTFDENEITPDDINDSFIHFTFLKEYLQQNDIVHNDNGNNNDNNHLVKQDEIDSINILLEFKKLIDKIENIKAINKNTKQQLLIHMEKLSNVINNIDDNQLEPEL